MLQHDDGRLFIDYDTNPSTEMGEQEGFGETKLEALENLKTYLLTDDPDSYEHLFGMRATRFDLFEPVTTDSKPPLRDRLASTVEAVPLGQYRHSKGTLYQVIGYTLHTETDEPLVSYIEAHSPEPFSYSRPPHMFYDPVTWPDGTIGPRFKRETVSQEHCTKAGAHLPVDHEPER